MLVKRPQMDTDQYELLMNIILDTVKHKDDYSLKLHMDSNGYITIDFTEQNDGKYAIMMFLNLRDRVYRFEKIISRKTMKDIGYNADEITKVEIPLTGVEQKQILDEIYNQWDELFLEAL